MTQSFPPGFLWGAATSAYQIEGGHDLNGKGPSIWDTFCRQPRRVYGAHTGERACDHVNRWAEDVAIMADLGLNAYRFSVSWPRVLPAGTGRVNEPGLDFYDRLVDALLARGITPFLNLYHWDLPQALQNRGGWEMRSTARAFENYAHVVADRLGDRVQNWITLNEPWCAAFLGHLTGQHAPGRRSARLSLRTAHHLLLGHGLAVRAIRAAAPRAQVGIVLNLAVVQPARDRLLHKALAWGTDLWVNRWLLDGVFRGTYPAAVRATLYGAGCPVKAGDLAVIGSPLDFAGINYYTRALVKPTLPQGTPEAMLERNPGAEYTLMDWEVYPPGLVDMVLRVHREYRPKAIYITENGAAFTDPPPRDGRVQDPRRQAYLQAHLEQLQSAIAAGAPVKGYFVWSLLDNFEWAFGYTKPFGLVHVDYSTCARTIKDSGRWYAGVARANALP